MPIYASTYKVSVSPFKKANEMTDSITYMPLYSLGGFEETCDAWFQGTGSSGQPFTWNWNMTSSKSEDWSALGHSTSATSIGGGSKGGLFGLLSFSAGTSSTSQSSTYSNWTSNSLTSISIELTMMGAPITFNVRSGYW